jgi:glycosyltransferase involved in cell wall biosynthesis
VLLRAAAEVVRKMPRVKFLLVGEGGEAAHLKELALRDPLVGRVVFTGFRADVPRILSACDLNVLTPVAGDSFPVALLEGAAAGLPAVATDVGGIKGICRDGVTGLLCPPGDVGAIAHSIARLLADPELRERLGRNAFAMIRNEYTEGIMLDKAEALFRRLLDEGGAGPA